MCTSLVSLLVFRVVTPCGLVRYQCFRETYCLALKMEIVYFSETKVYTYKVDYQQWHLHYCKNTDLSSAICIKAIKTKGEKNRTTRCHHDLFYILLSPDKLRSVECYKCVCMPFRVEEFWEPQLEELDPLVVVREVPTIHILLSKDPLNTAEPG